MIVGRNKVDCVKGHLLMKLLCISEILFQTKHAEVQKAFATYKNRNACLAPF